jgi:hypothetical protein
MDAIQTWRGPLEKIIEFGLGRLFRVSQISETVRVAL